MSPVGFAVAFRLAHLGLGDSILFAELSGLAIIATAMFGSHVLSERAFRLLRYMRDRPEPPSPAMSAGASSRPTARRNRSRQLGPRRPATSRRGPYQVRPGRHALVIDDLARLRGPVTGVVELPLRLFWSLPGYRFNLNDPETCLWYYQTVLREASRVEDLTAYLDAATLVRLWPELYLPKGVRQTWEDRHESLHAATDS